MAFSVNVSHRLSEQEAMSRTRDGFRSLGEKYADRISDLNESWNGSCGQVVLKVHIAVTVPLSATVRVGPSSVAVHGDVPWWALAFTSSIETFIREHLEKCLTAS